MSNYHINIISLVIIFTQSLKITKSRKLLQCTIVYIVYSFYIILYIYLYYITVYSSNNKHETFDLNNFQGQKIKQILNWTRAT